MPDRILSYFDFTGEDIDGNYIEDSFCEPMTLLRAEFEVKRILRGCGGGHIDVWYAETGEFAFDVEV
jgi:hypothetical protein